MSEICNQCKYWPINENGVCPACVLTDVLFNSEKHELTNDYIQRLCEIINEGPEKHHKNPNKCQCGSFIEQVGNELLCLNDQCGVHHGYIYVFTDYQFYKKRPSYNIKYHLKKKLGQYKLNDNCKVKFLDYFNSALYAYRQCSNKRHLIKLDFIFRKIFKLMELHESASRCKPVKTKWIRKKYETIWCNICRINDWEYQL